MKRDVFNEGKACDAVIRVLEAREGQSRRDLCSPEKSRHHAPIELTCWIGRRLYAFEHTGIEPFAGHVKMEAEAKRHLDPIKSAIAGTLPPNNVYELHIPILALQGRRGRELREIQTALAGWIATTAPTTEVAPYGSYAKPAMKVISTRAPFEVSLYCFLAVPPETAGLQIRARVAYDLEGAREKRIREACVRKYPKLEVWRRDEGARTVLVLEENDLQLTNPQRVYEGLLQVERTFASKPDEVYLVSTMIENPWYVHALRIGEQSYYRLSELRQCMTEINSGALDDLTDR